MWYEDIEAEIIAREEYETVSTTIGQFDSYIHKLELKALRYTAKNGFQPQIYSKTVRDIYFTETGEKRSVDTRINEQNLKWIHDFIQKEAASVGIRISPVQIKYTLHDVSMAYHAAEIKRTSVAVRLSDSLRHRLRETLEKTA